MARMFVSFIVWIVVVSLGAGQYTGFIEYNRAS